MDMSTFWSSNDGACRVPSLIRGSLRSRGVAKTVCWASDVASLLDNELASRWQT
jgi:hypothetical protein